MPVRKIIEGVNAHPRAQSRQRHGDGTTRLLIMAEAIAHAGHWRFDVRTRELVLSDGINKIFGFSGDLTPTPEAALATFSARERTRIRRIIAQAFAGGDAYAFVSQITRADGSLRDVVASGSIERDGSGTAFATMGVVQDVTDRRDAERERDVFIERCTVATRAGRIGIWEREIGSPRLVWDHTMFDLYGLDYDAAFTRDRWWACIHPDDRDAVQSVIDLALEQRDAYEIEFRIVRPDGEIRVIRAAATIIRNSRGRARRVIGANWDVTENRRLEQALQTEKQALGRSEAVYRALAEGIPQLVHVVDAGGRFTYVNARWTSYTGLTLEAAASAGAARLLAPESEPIVSEHRAQVPPREFECEVRMRRHDGAYRWHLYRSVPFTDGYGAEMWLVSTTDVEDRKSAEMQLARAASELARLAHHDPLTNLPNRKLLMDRLCAALAQATRDTRGVIVLYLDLDRFKTINDRFGHAAGDLVLVETAARIVGTLRAGDTVSRVGGDEFVMICTARDDEEDAAMLAARLITVVSQPIEAAGMLLSVGASIGSSQSSLHSDVDALMQQADALIQQADAAMYAAKQAGRNTYRAYSADMYASMRRTMRLEIELRAAVAMQQFVVHYQPIVALESGRLIGAEALVRWQHPQRGLIVPAAFIPFAEEHGQIVEIGWQVMDRICADLRALQLGAGDTFAVAVNVSAQQFGEADFVGKLARTIAQGAVDFEQLEIEITESTVMANTPATDAILHGLRKLGVKLSLDDFGTGYSSLAYVKNFPIDTLKIDRSFVRDIATSRTDAALAKTIVTLAHSLDMRVIGEGVETAAQLEALRQYGVDCAQGHLFGAPMPLAEFAARRNAFSTPAS